VEFEEELLTNCLQVSLSPHLLAFIAMMKLLMRKISCIICSEWSKNSGINAKLPVV